MVIVTRNMTLSKEKFSNLTICMQGRVNNLPKIFLKKERGEMKRKKKETEEVVERF